MTRHALPALAAMFALAAHCGAAEPSADFFENKVRPLLAEHCTRCHGAAKQQGGLRLDTAAGLAEGAAGSAVVTPGDPDAGLLMAAVRRTGDYPMPPGKPLKGEEVAVLAAWVKAGAVFPKPDAAAAKKSDAAATHWAFQPVRDPQPPATMADAGDNPIDAFVTARLEAAGLTMAPPAGRAALIRRAYYDLIGLPPTVDQVTAFVEDPSPDAFARVVDELLASPHYGERWGRHWLDLARYADSKGYVFTESRAYPNAYTFRDYVIRSLNDDKPYDRFVAEQLAADQLDLGGDPRPLAALGFLTVGRRFSNNQYDIADDRIDVVTRGLMGLTVQCARCHDHKFDPVGIRDYYALYGVFASCEEPKELPQIGQTERTPAVERFEASVRERRRAIDDFRARRHAEIVAELRKPEVQANYFDAARKLAGRSQAEVRDLVKQERLRPAALGRVRRFLELPLAERFRRTLAGDGPAEVPFAEFDSLLLVQDRNKLRDLQKKLDTFVAESPVAPPRAMVLTDRPNPGDERVFLRGNPKTRGDVVPRGFLAVGPLARTEVMAGSGRLELARAVTSPDNPLTARVLVNRVWMQHFGQPLVRTPSDFGLRSEPPTHPELLDWLATRFVQDGWSLKQLHRRMMLSRAYRQASAAAADAPARDPENRLLSHANRRRLDFESLRDSLLAAAGRLDPTVYGRSVDLFERPYTARRAVYAEIDRQNLPGTLRSFDVANPDLHSPGRFTTTVPQQALFLMNSPFVIEQARGVAARSEIARETDSASRVRQLYRAVLARDAAADEVAAALAFVVATPEKPWELLAQVLLCSNEFAFID